jgi:hypothetical protein
VRCKGQRYSDHTVCRTLVLRIMCSLGKYLPRCSHLDPNGQWASVLLFRVVARETAAWCVSLFSHQEKQGLLSSTSTPCRRRLLRKLYLFFFFLLFFISTSLSGDAYKVADELVCPGGLYRFCPNGLLYRTRLYRGLARVL